MLARRRAALLLLVLGAAAAHGAGCSSDRAATLAPSGEQSKRGVQGLDEDKACERLRDAEEKARRRLDCEPLERPPCPDYVRPPSHGCYTYDATALAHCEAVLSEYESCRDFTESRCLLTAVPGGARCSEGGGEGGQGGDPAADAASGAAGTAG